MSIIRHPSPVVMLSLVAVALVGSALGVMAQETTPELAEIIARQVRATYLDRTPASVRSLRLSGVYAFRGNEYPLTITRLRPHFLRLEIIVEGRRRVFGFDGEDSWELDEARSARPAPIRDTRDQRFIELGADFDGPLVDHLEKGHRVEMAGIVDVDGVAAHHLRVGLRGGIEESWYLDRVSGRLLKRSSTVSYRDQEFEQSIFYLDYRPVDGMLLPHYVERTDAHYVRGYEIDTVEINPEVDPALFRAPVAEPDSAPEGE